MGSFEIIHFWFLIIFLVVVVVGILSFFSLKNLLLRFGLLRTSNNEFYECGFKPVLPSPASIAIQFIIICIFFILYDIEPLFSFPLISAITEHYLFDLFLFFFFYGTFVFTLVFDFDRFLTNWRR